MKWAKTKALESCWGEDNMKLYTVNMKKAVAKCQQQDAPELDLPPFRAVNRLVNNMVSMAGHREDQNDEMKYFMKFFTFMKMMKMMDHDDDDDHEDHHDSRYTAQPYMQYNQKDHSDNNMMDKMKMMMMMKKMDYSGDKMEDYMQNRKDDFSLDSMWRSMGQMRFKRQADDSLALNDRLKEKLEDLMKKHVDKVSNMTCVLRELNVIDKYNNIDVEAIKEDAEQYKMPSPWFGERYEQIVESCYEVAENLPAALQDKVLPNNYNGPMRNLG